jgi:eukaryotic-like serine/threonine-protein kinase
MEAVPERLGQFRISSLLGQGGAGTVYAALEAERPVALKVLRADLELEPREVQRFLAEADRLTRVDHPHVVRLLGSGCLPDGRPYLAMPLLGGTTLAARLAEGPLPRPFALELFGQLAAAVGALHAVGLLHRDLKPENVMLVAPDRLVLLDFGIAREAEGPPSTTTRAGVIRGTPAYMAPEIFFGGPATVASDIYQLGVVLYQMLSGELPWPASNPGDAGARLNPHPPRGVPPTLAREVLRAIATVPESRPDSAADFAARVAAAAAAPDETPRSTLPLAPAITPHETPHPTARPRARLALMGVLLVAVVAAALVWRRGFAPPAAPPPAAAPAAAAAPPPPAPATVTAPAVAGAAAADRPPAPATVPALVTARKPARPAAAPPPPAPATVTAPAPTPAPPPPPAPAGANDSLACSARLVKLHCDTDYFIVYPDRCSWYRLQLAELRKASPDQQTQRELWCLSNYGQLSSTAQLELRRYFRGRRPPAFKDDLECVRKVRDLVCSPAYQAIEKTSCADWNKKLTGLPRLAAKERSATAYLCRLEYTGLTDQVTHALRTRPAGAGTKAP